MPSLQVLSYAHRALSGAALVFLLAWGQPLAMASEDTSKGPDTTHTQLFSSSHQDVLALVSCPTTHSICTTEPDASLQHQESFVTLGTFLGTVLGVKATPLVPTVLTKWGKLTTAITLVIATATATIYTLTVQRSALFAPTAHRPLLLLTGPTDEASLLQGPVLTDTTSHAAHPSHVETTQDTDQKEDTTAEPENSSATTDEDAPIASPPPTSPTLAELKEMGYFDHDL